MSVRLSATGLPGGVFTTRSAAAAAGLRLAGLATGAAGGMTTNKQGSYTSAMCSGLCGHRRIGSCDSLQQARPWSSTTYRGHCQCMFTLGGEAPSHRSHFSDTPHRAQQSKDAVAAQEELHHRRTATAVRQRRERHTLSHTPEHTARAAASPRTHQGQDPPLGGRCHPREP